MDVTTQKPSFMELRTQETAVKRDRLIGDLGDMYDLEAGDRYSFIQSVLESNETEVLPHLYLPNQLSPVQEWYIQDFCRPGEIGLQSIDIHQATTVYQADKSLFTDLKQCSLIEADTVEYAPYLRATISECSVLIARDKTRLWAAHLGMSQESQLVSALAGLKRSGFEISDIRVVASVGEYQRAMNKNGYARRLASVADYEKYGIGRQQIVAFEYDTFIDEDNAIAQRLCELVIGKDGTLIGNYDITTQDRPNSSVTYKKKLNTVEEIYVPAAN